MVPIQTLRGCILLVLAVAIVSISVSGSTAAHLYTSLHVLALTFARLLGQGAR